MCTVIHDPTLCPPFPYIVNSNDTTLSFLDDPANHALPDGSFMAFSTSLVGVSNAAIPGSVSCGPNQKVARYCTYLSSWKWRSNFNGMAGGVSQTFSIYPIDPGSGTGGVTITSIDGVTLPPVLTSSQVEVTASGLAYSRVSQTFDGTLTVSNISSSPIIGPLQILFFGLPVNVALVNATSNLSSISDGSCRRQPCA
jgi:hypothetical protein